MNEMETRRITLAPSQEVRSEHMSDTHMLNTASLRPQAAIPKPSWSLLECVPLWCPVDELDFLLKVCKADSMESAGLMDNGMGGTMVVRSAAQSNMTITSCKKECTHASEIGTFIAKVNLRTKSSCEDGRSLDWGAQYSKGQIWVFPSRRQQAMSMSEAKRHAKRRQDCCGSLRSVSMMVEAINDELDWDGWVSAATTRQKVLHKSIATTKTELSLLS